MRQFSTIVSPCDFVGGRAGPHGALKVHVVTLLDVGGVEAAAKGEGTAWHNWKTTKQIFIEIFQNQF